MHRPDLVKKILDYIRTTYNAEYVGRLEVIQTDTTYVFIIGLPSYMIPTSITYQTEDENDFLNYIYEELRTRNYMRLIIYKVTKIIDGDQEQRINEV